MHSNKISIDERVSVDVNFSEVEFKYLTLFIKYKSVDRVAKESGMSARSVSFHLKSIEWTLKSAGCFR
jgi:hypothetical protein